MKKLALYWYIFSEVSLSTFPIAHGKELCHYLLPFAPGQTHRTLQGYFGKYSHKAPLEYGVDFEMKEGTAIHAARSGIVISIKDDSNQSGKDKSYLEKANYIKVEHSDKTISYYAHLKFRGVLVKKGQKIFAGQHIGYSGCTGWCDGAHLHFEVHETKNGLSRRTLPIQFITKQGVVKNMERQKSYTAVLTDQNLCK
ncbi:MAG: M23 family metallopeptidase [Deltaproteobacteria bacterium]|nr:MAG: M23 family metallopeptidase [Deltaproteobacteria bacterium]